MTSDTSVRLRATGRRLYRLAWLIEVVAVVVGFGLAMVIGYDALAKAGGAFAVSEFVLASGGFVIVALAEITKIPLATALVHVRWLWKPLLLALMALMAMITFETVFFSLERGFTLRMRGVEAQRQAVDELEGERAAVQADPSRAEGTADAGGNGVEAMLDVQRRGPMARIEMLRKEIERLKVQALPPEAADLDVRIEKLEARIDKVIGKREAEKQTVVDRFESQRASFETRIKDAREHDEQDYVRKMQAELQRLPGPQKALKDVDARYAAELGRLDDEAAGLRERRAGLDLSPSPEIRARLKEMQGQLDATLAELAAIDARAAELRGRENEDALKRLDARGAAEARLRGLDAALVAARAELARLAGLDQVHRMAGAWYGKPPAEVSSQEAKSVAVFWFGSLALLAAIAGVATAIVSQALMLLADAMERKARPAKLRHLLRRWLLAWRWRRVRTVERRIEVPVERIIEKEVERIVEVPVEKIVEKEVEKIVQVPVDRIVEKEVDRVVEVVVEREVEKPVEVLVKEIIYVPILTDDPEALRAALVRDLPPEMTSLLKVEQKGNGYAHAA